VVWPFNRVGIRRVPGCARDGAYTLPVTRRGLRHWSQLPPSVCITNTPPVVNSVNFPTTVLEPRGKDVAARLCITNTNTSGLLGSITTAVGELGVNIVQQINTSRGDVAYNAIDMESIPGSPEEFIDNSNKFSGILNARLILGANSTYFQTFHNEDKE
jgi:hypothetical protein